MTSFFVWDPATLGLNVPEMDREHQVLIGLMNRLHELHTEGAATVTVAKVLDELVSFTKTHFADEEAYMARTGYSELKNHALIHKQLLDQVSGYIAQFQKAGKLTDAFFSFLKFWLRAHICGIDMKYSPKAHAA